MIHPIDQIESVRGPTSMRSTHIGTRNHCLLPARNLKSVKHGSASQLRLSVARPDALSENGW